MENSFTTGVNLFEYLISSLKKQSSFLSCFFLCFAQQVRGGKTSSHRHETVITINGLQILTFGFQFGSNLINSFCFSKSELKIICAKFQLFEVVDVTILVDKTVTELQRRQCCKMKNEGTGQRFVHCFQLLQICFRMFYKVQLVVHVI